jgi:hypothetical protein
LSVFRPISTSVSTPTDDRTARRRSARIRRIPRTRASSNACARTRARSNARRGRGRDEVFRASREIGPSGGRARAPRRARRDRTRRTMRTRGTSSDETRKREGRGGYCSREGRRRRRRRREMEARAHGASA